MYLFNLAVWKEFFRLKKEEINAFFNKSLLITTAKLIGITALFIGGILVIVFIAWGTSFLIGFIHVKLFNLTYMFVQLDDTTCNIYSITGFVDIFILILTLRIVIPSKKWLNDNWNLAVYNIYKK